MVQACLNIFHNNEVGLRSQKAYDSQHEFCARKSIYYSSCSRRPYLDSFSRFWHSKQVSMIPSWQTVNAQEFHFHVKAKFEHLGLGQFPVQ